MRKIHLIFGCHCHQPVGNFEHVMERIYEDAYLPFLRVVSGHPKIKVVLHYTGVLLDWMEEKHPEFLELLERLVHRGQAEILTGSYYEAILTVIPEKDQVEQVQRLTRFISRRFHLQPRGMWLAERIWETKLARTLPGAGVEFALVDDFHFKAAGLKEDQLLGYFNTEEEGSLFSLFPISERLRYSTPFQKVENTIDYLRQMSEHGENPLLVIVDDGEKFGCWPGTRKWVYEEGWLENFLRALEENSQWIETTTCSEYRQNFSPAGLIYLPVCSYFNMGEWSLPAGQAVEYQNLIRKLKAEDLLERYKGFLKGGIWRNFFVKYPESNHLHKKMLGLSRSVQKMAGEMTDDPQRRKSLEAARTALLKSQCNDGYWHGIFGGLYLPHLRDALYRHLIEGEKTIESIIHKNDESWVEAEVTDMDGDGSPEVILNNRWLKAYFDPGEGGTMVELDYKPNNFNLVNTLARRFEHYHQTISESLKEKASRSPEERTSIHEINKSGDMERMKELLVYDDSRRACLADHLLDPSMDLAGFRARDLKERADFSRHPYEHKLKKEKERVTLTLRRKGIIWQNNSVPAEIVKHVRLVYNEPCLDIDYRLINRGDKALNLVFGVEFNFAMLAGNIPEVSLFFPRKDESRYLMATSGTKAGVKTVVVENRLEKFSVSLSADQESDLWWFPVETISQSEKGFDLTYQSTVILPRWAVSLPRDKEWTVRLRLAIHPLPEVSNRAIT